MAVVLDDAHAFAPPIMGALAELDVLRLLGRHARRRRGSASTTSSGCLGARGARPLSTRWSGSTPGTKSRWPSPARAPPRPRGPRFDHLVDPLPPSADDEAARGAVGRGDELTACSGTRRAETPAPSTRSAALAMDEDDVVQVVPPELLDIADLEAPRRVDLVLRSVLQLAPATRPRLAEATLLRRGRTTCPLRARRGYVERKPDGAYRVT